MTTEHLSELAVRIVRDGLHDTRVWLGEITDEQATYQPRHAKEQP